MGKFDGWAIISDIDHTLLPHGMMQVSEANKEAISYWRSEGGIFTFATGRYLGGALNICRDMEVTLPFIYNNGSAIYLPDTQSFASVLTLGNGIFSVLNDVRTHFPHCGVAGYNEETMFLIQKNDILDAHFERQKLAPSFMKNEEDLRTFCKVLITTNAERMNELKLFLSDKPYANQYHFSQSTPEFFEITPQGATKGSQLTNLCALLHQQMSQIITVGDNENDISLLEASSFSFAVANATPAAKKAARFVTTSRGDTESALPEIIETAKIFIGKEKDNGKI